MTNISIFACPHGKKYDELVASKLEKKKYEAYFVELPQGSDIIERCGPGPLEASYNFAINNKSPIYYIDDNELLDKNVLTDSYADSISFYILKYKLEKLLGERIYK